MSLAGRLQSASGRQGAEETPPERLEGTQPLDSRFPAPAGHTRMKAWRLPLFPIVLSLMGGSVGKETACNAGDPGSIPGLERAPGEEE